MGQQTAETQLKWARQGIVCKKGFGDNDKKPLVFQGVKGLFVSLWDYSDFLPFLSPLVFLRFLLLKITIRLTPY